MTETHDYLERTRLENENARLQNKLDSLHDVLRAAQQLVDAIHTQTGTDTTKTTGGPFSDAYSNLRRSLKNHYLPNGLPNWPH
jgi:hypothetical protein